MPDSIEEIQKRILESLRKDVLRINRDKSIVLLSLFNFASAFCNTKLKEHAVKNPLLFEVSVRDAVFSLHLILNQIGSPFEKANSFARLREFQISKEVAEKTDALFDHAHWVQTAYDIFLCSFLDGYTIIVEDDSTLKVFDSKDWEGKRDFANQEIRSFLEMERNRSGSISKLNAEENFRNRFVFPLEEKMFSLTIDEFISSWFKLRAAFSESIRSGRIFLESNSNLFQGIKQIIGLDNEKTNHLISLLTFRYDQELQKSLMFHPLVPASINETFVFAFPFVSANLEVLIPRYLVYRTKTYDPISTKLEKMLTDKLRNHFQTPNQMVIKSKKFVYKGKQFEIDAIFHDKESNKIILVECKYFILPDMVVEVMKCNKALEKAIGQIKNIKEWVDQGGKETVYQWLGIESSGNETFEFTIVTNGFIGSDFLKDVDLFPVVDFKFLMLDKYRSKSIDSAIKEYLNLFFHHISKFKTGDKSERFTFELYGYKFETPHQKTVSY